MDFLNPLFLVMLGAVAVPILIHFFSRRKIPEIVFSSLIFLRGSERRSMRKIDFRRLLLLLLRVAGVALIALAFARPVIRGGLAAIFPGEGSGAVCILIDRSYSMSVEEGETTAFQKGIDRALEITGMLGEEDEVAIYLFDTRVIKILETDRFRAAQVSEILKKQETSFYGTDLAAAVAAGRERLLSGRREIRELFIISDFQKSGFTAGADLPENALDISDSSGGVGREERRRIRTFLIPVGEDAPANVSIDKVVTPGKVVHKGETAAVSVVMRNHSQRLGAKFPIRISVDGKIVHEREIEIAPAGSKTEKALIQIDRSGWIEGLASKRNDRLKADDSRFFSFHSRKRDRVLLISDSEEYYLRQALNPGENDEEIELRRKKWDDFVTADLDWADLVIAGPGVGPAQREIGILEEYLSGGGGIFALVTRGHEKMIKELSNHQPGVDFNGREETIDYDQEKPPFLSPFDREDMKALFRIRFRGPPVVTGIPPGEVDLRFESGHPFVWSESVEKGRIVFASIDPVPEGGDLVLSPLFLPLVRQLLFSVDPALAGTEGRKVGERFVLRREAEGIRAVLPGGVEYIPSDLSGGAPGKVEKELSAGAMITAGDEPGFVRIEAADSTIELIPVNIESSAESRLEKVETAVIADMLGVDDSVLIPQGGDLLGHLEMAREGREISGALVIAALMIFFVELLVSQRKDMAAARSDRDVG
ncbi:MAG: BatA and WFA domain-containing protein [Candidatus Krumholzibacteriota bacterium]|nr:BatA and WFA domain-containing protein [Candidatus Krumholzibacteriota bacterium]